VQPISRLYFLVNSTATIPVNTCHGFYDRASNSVYLYNDPLTALLVPITPGGSGSTANNQCSIDAAGSKVVAAPGTDVVVDLKMTLLGTFGSASKSVYIWVQDNGGLGTGWVQTGTWNPYSAVAPTAAGSPSSVSGPWQTLAFQGRDGNGFADIQRIYFLVHPTPTIPTGTCHGFFDRASGGIYLYDDSLTVLSGPLIPGNASNLSNSQCRIEGVGTSITTASGAELTLNVYGRLFGTTTKNVYLWVVDNAGAGTGWVQVSTWNPN
jgi:hypothetical protein